MSTLALVMMAPTLALALFGFTRLLWLFAAWVATLLDAPHDAARREDAGPY